MFSGDKYSVYFYLFNNLSSSSRIKVISGLKSKISLLSSEYCFLYGVMGYQIVIFGIAEEQQVRAV